jgi:5-formyltetrahydrofolate cyclo-ligase
MYRDERKRLRKRALRRATVSAILDLDPAARLQQEAALICRFPTLPGYAESRTVLFYVRAFPEELDTRSLIGDALVLGKRVVCPRVDRLERRLMLFQIASSEQDLEPGILGIPEPRPTCPLVEPSDIDWALIPGLAFDPHCNRLGRGGGHYDRLMPLLRPDAPRWALGFDCQLVDEIPVEPHDVPVDGVATPNAVVRRS